MCCTVHRRELAGVAGRLCVRQHVVHTIFDVHRHITTTWTASHLSNMMILEMVRVEETKILTRSMIVSGSWPFAPPVGLRTGEGGLSNVSTMMRRHQWLHDWGPHGSGVTCCAACNANMPPRLACRDVRCL